MVLDNTVIQIIQLLSVKDSFTFQNAGPILSIKIGLFHLTIFYYFLSIFRDLCAAYGANILPLVDTDVISEFLTQGRRSKASKAKTLSAWATKEIRKLKNANSSW